MADNRCPECGELPGECYGICPMNDPYHGDQAAEAANHDFNAQFDDVRERYMEHCPRHGTYAGDCGGCEAEHYEGEEEGENIMPVSLQNALIGNLMPVERDEVEDGRRERRDFYRNRDY